MRVFQGDKYFWMIGSAFCNQVFITDVVQFL